MKEGKEAMREARREGKCNLEFKAQPRIFR
jgi:hypothetical protein